MGRKRRKLPFWREVSMLALGAVVLALLVRTFLVQTFSAARSKSRTS